MMKSSRFHTFPSKTPCSLQTIPEIQFALDKLVKRINNGNGKIHHYVKEEILRCLLIYTSLIEKATTYGHIEGDRASTIRNLISLAKEKLMEMSSIQEEWHLVNFEKFTTKDVKRFILEVQKCLQSNKLDNRDYETILKRAVLFSKYCPEYDRKSKEEEKLVILILELFLKTLPDTSETCNESINNVNTPSLTSNIKREEREEKNYLKINDLEEEKTGIKLQNSEPHENNCENSVDDLKHIIMKQTEINVNEVLNAAYHTILEKVEERFDQFVEGIKNHVEEQGKKFETETSKSCHNDISKRLIDIKKAVSGALDETENEINKIIEHSNVSVEEKLSQLDNLAKLTNEISCHDLQERKPMIVNKIEGVLLRLSTDYLRKLKIKIDSYKIYAQQFPYPMSAIMREKKGDEIGALRNCLENLPKDFDCVKLRKQLINETIDEVSCILTKRAEFNEKIIAELDDLEMINDDLPLIGKSILRSDDIKNFVAIRRKLGDVGSHHHRLILRKLQILDKLQKIEKQFYPTLYPESVNEMKMILDNLEKEVYGLGYDQPNEGFEELKEKILKLMEDVEEEICQYHMNDESGGIIMEVFDLVLDCLDKSRIKIEEENKALESLKVTKNRMVTLSSSNIPTRRRISQLKTYEKEVREQEDKLKSPKALELFQDTEKEIVVLRSSIKVKDLEVTLGKLKESVSNMNDLSDPNLFKTIDKTIQLKESFEDLPDEISDKKQIYLNEILEILQKLDHQFADFVITQSVDLSCNPLEDDQKREKNAKFHDYLISIQEETELLEDCVKNFLGTIYSKEYFRLIETFERMLDKLDNISCQCCNEEVSEIRIRIKKLTEELTQNAISL